MGQEPVFDRIVFGTIGRIVDNPNFNPKLIGQGLQFLLKNIMARTLAAATITEHENGGGGGIVVSAVGGPPMPKTLAGKFAGKVGL